MNYEVGSQIKVYMKDGSTLQCEILSNENENYTCSCLSSNPYYKQGDIIYVNPLESKIEKMSIKSIKEKLEVRLNKTSMGEEEFYGDRGSNVDSKHGKTVASVKADAFVEMWLTWDDLYNDDDARDIVFKTIPVEEKIRLLKGRISEIFSEKKNSNDWDNIEVDMVNEKTDDIILRNFIDNHYDENEELEIEKSNSPMGQVNASLKKIAKRFNWKFDKHKPQWKFDKESGVIEREDENIYKLEKLNKKLNILL